MGDVLPNSVCSKCGAKNTLEVDPHDPEGGLHCWACGTYQDKTQETQKMDYLLERHQFYEKNKSAILADVKAIGEKATAKKWKVNGASLFHVLRRWEREEKNKSTELTSISKNPLPPARIEKIGKDLYERHRYYEKNKEAIIADLLKIGRKATMEKWGIGKGSSLFVLEKRWLTPEQKALLNRASPFPRGGRSKSTTPKSITSKVDRTGLPPLPPFSNDWPQEMQETWLRIYWILIMKTMPPLDVKDI
jgi:hypothetical protein